MCNATLAPAKKTKAKKPAPVVEVKARTIKVKLKNYDWVVINTSGGKDSQTLLRQVVLKARAEGYPLERIVAVHCDLGHRVEWDGVRELAEEQARHHGVRFEVVSRPQGDILDEVKQRAVSIWSKAVRTAGETPVEGFEALREQAVRVTGGDLPAAWPSSDNRYCTSHHKTNQVSKVLTKLASPWPSQDARWCTSDQKRGQVARVLTQLAAEVRTTGKQRPVRILNCMGMRAAESPARSKLKPFKLDKAQTNGRRTVHTYLPLFDWGVEQVWADIKESGVPHHPAYDMGMGRLSCCFCIYSPRAALLLAGKYNRAKLDEYVRVEREVGSRFRVELSLLEVRDALDRGEEPGEVGCWEMP